MRKFALGVALVAFVGGGASGALAQMREHDPPAEYRYPPYTGAMRLCSDPTVLNEISFSFADREADYWNSGLTIESFYPPEEFGYRTNGLSYLPRRYCRTLALFNDGVVRKVVYNVGEALGFIGVDSGVTWCVEGLDRNHAFSPNCRAAGP
ncbi:MAG: hypothetical protein ACR652_01650 [Methylocystis sp.]|uniref:hypothetical protein n=1 Tax=Methylocystis sp. TaxID=1911079 RepID=UPI003DA602D5